MLGQYLKFYTIGRIVGFLPTPNRQSETPGADTKAASRLLVLPSKFVPQQPTNDL